MPTLDRSGDVFVLDLGDTENRFHPDWLAAVDAAADAFRQARGLSGEPALEGWLAANDLRPGPFAALLREEHAVHRATTGAAADLGPFLRSQLRADGRYSGLVARIRAKRRLDRGLPADDATTGPALRWYFGRYGQQPPADLGPHWQGLDFPDEAAFARAVRREYLYSAAGAPPAAGDGTSPPEGSTR